jgi:hypothetical protein
MLLLETSLKMTGDGMHMIQLKEVIGSVIKMLFITCVEKPLKPCLNWNLTECHFQELPRVLSFFELRKNLSKSFRRIIFKIR